MSKNREATIIGAGLGGVMMAIRLARRGYTVEVYERRPNVDKAHLNQRSFTITLSKRGLNALNEIGLMQDALAITIPLRGRMVHARDGSTLYVPYGKANNEQIYSIRRHDMNALLYRKAEEFPNIRFHFNHRLMRLEKESNMLWFETENESEQPCNPVKAELLIGGDGVFSMVRQQMQRGERADFHQDFLSWGYKDIFLPAAANGRHSMEPNALHLWPRGNCTFFAFPNIDGTFSGNFIGPFDFIEKSQEPEALQALLQQDFADLLEVAPALPQQICSAPASHFITVHTSQWHYKDQIVLLGDAAHAVTPFWGEGMNASFEDTAVLDRSLAAFPEDTTAAFAAYQAERKPNTDMLANLAKQNFVELRDTTASPLVLARKTLERSLYQLFPEQWLPLNIMISHRLMSYVEAVARYQKQQKVARYCGLDLVVWLLALGLIGQRLWEKFVRSLAIFNSPALHSPAAESRHAKR
ncbi:MAG: NAD(P)/FAD-dependent oxidoreductase [Caldilineaceae bacterium]